MVRRIFLVLENEKYEKLQKLKGDKTWEKLLVDDLLEQENDNVVNVVSRRSKSNET